MAATDTVILIVLGICVFVGAKNGVIRQIGGIVGLILGVYLAYRFSPSLAESVSGRINCPSNVSKVIAFTLIMTATLLAMSLLGRILESIFSAAAIGWINRLLGIILSLSIGILLIGVVLNMLKFVDSNWFPILGDSEFSESKLAEPILSIIDKVFPYLKKVF